MAFIEIGEGDQPNHVRAFATRPAVHAAWDHLRQTIAGNMDERRYELVTLAAACALRSSYCALAHGSILADRFLPAETVRQLAIDHRNAGLAEVDVAIMDLAAKVATDATSVSAEDVDRLRRLGLADDEVLDVVLAATARCFYSKTLDGLGVRADAAFAGLEGGLRDALTVGRPIAEA